MNSDESTYKKTVTRIVRGLLWVMFVILIMGSVALSVFTHLEVSDLSRRLESTHESILELWNSVLDIRWAHIQKTTPSIDLTVPSLQNIGSGFYISNLSVDKHLTGIKIKGRVINATSLIHSSIKFEMRVGEKEKEFTINLISPGNSTGFEVYVPDVPVEECDTAYLRYVESMISYKTE